MPDTVTASAIDTVELTRKLVRCESVTPREGGALQHLEAVLTPLGFRCERMDFSEAGTDDVANLYARIGQPKEGNGKHFCFAGHSDVVPVGDLSSWTIGPFAAELSGGYLFGRGAADMKGAIAAFTEAAARFVARRGTNFGGAISLLITGDEEGPAVNGTVKMLKKLAERGETIDACVVGEPTSSKRFGDMIKIGRRGSMTVDLVVRGIQGHVGYPERLDNAVHRLSAIIEALVREPIDQGSTHFQPSSLQFTTVDVGNSATNIAPGVVRARFNTRFNDLWTSKKLLAHLQERIERANAKLGGNGTVEYAKVEVSGESFYTPPGALVDLVAGAIRDVAGVEPELSTTGGTSDARFIASYCPVLEFGLVGESMHKVDEKSAVADLKMLARVYETVLDRYFAA
ncbi:MAG TPA: succinyl-diaminopimelate desuccinylase [Reyranellaceae bacterium]|nr:succinyl-diaminopimelate desuccinylase [Reyranellaceae bacterium]